MINKFFKAHLFAPLTIEVTLISSTVVPDDFAFSLLKDDKFLEKPKIIKKTSAGNIYHFFLGLSKELEPGYDYTLAAPQFPLGNLDVSPVTGFEGFDEKYAYDGPLGAEYHPTYTIFRLWSPTAFHVQLKIGDGKEFHFKRMVRKDHGVFEVRINEDCLNKQYHYIVNTSGIIRETNDPYGVAVSLNSEYSVVVDLKEVKDLGTVKPTLKCPNPVDAMIYETHIRDFTEDSGTDIKNKGTYLGLVEEGRKTAGGNPAGLDYLKYLGITHLQIQPIHDFRGVDDITKEGYNWGYDPISYFAIEGSFSTNPSDPLCRLKEFKTMVNTLHKNNIRVIVDVVYNHFYEYTFSILEKSLPNYYFRKRSDGVLSNASGCGNDIDSKRYMVRRMIVDSIKHLVDLFDIDGVRIDLMGLLDRETVNKMKEYFAKKKKDFLFYGEGWDMSRELLDHEKVTTNHALALPDIGFFNEFYRDVVKGDTFRLYDQGFALGNTELHTKFEYAFYGSCLNYSLNKRFANANQSINYVECHDNHTLYDKLVVSNSDEDEDTILRRIDCINSLIMLSYGVPFIHMGQEVGLSKSGLGNTYNVNKVNNMKWKIVDERFEMVNNLKSMIEIRQKYLKYPHLFEPSEIENSFEFYQENDGIFYLRNNIEDIMIMVNTTNHPVNYTLHYYYEFLTDSDSVFKSGIMDKTSVFVLKKSNEQ